MMTLGPEIHVCLGLFGGSGGETLVIFLVILVLFGAKRLPEIAQQLGKSLQEFRKAARDVIDDEILAHAPKKDGKGSPSSPMGEEEIYKPYPSYESYEQSGQPYHSPDEYLDPGAYLGDENPQESPSSPSETSPYSDDTPVLEAADGTQPSDEGAEGSDSTPGDESQGTRPDSGEAQ